MEGLLEMNLLSTGIKTLSMLLVVLGLLLVVLYFIKRFSLRNNMSKGDVGIKVLSSLSLSTKDRIQVVEISGEKIVLGISPGGITCITKLCGNAENEQEDRHLHHEIDA